jgi:hypothetical protein
LGEVSLLLQVLLLRGTGIIIGFNIDHQLSELTFISAMYVCSEGFLDTMPSV